CMAVLGRDLGQPPLVPFYLLLAWLDDGFEAQGFTSRPGSRVVFAHRELADGEPQEIEPNAVLPRYRGDLLSHRVFALGQKRMADMGFGGLQFQPHALKPLLGDFLASPDRLEVWMQDDKVVGIADDRGRPWHTPPFDPSPGG